MSSFVSFALKIKFWSEILGAIELYEFLQKGHFFFTLAYFSMQSLQKVCPQGNKMKG